MYGVCLYDRCGEQTVMTFFQCNKATWEATRRTPHLEFDGRRARFFAGARSRRLHIVPSTARRSSRDVRCGRTSRLITSIPRDDAEGSRCCLDNQARLSLSWHQVPPELGPCKRVDSLSSKRSRRCRQAVEGLESVRSEQGGTHSVGGSVYNEELTEYESDCSRYRDAYTYREALRPMLVVIPEQLLALVLCLRFRALMI